MQLSQLNASQKTSWPKRATLSNSRAASARSLMTQMSNLLMTLTSELHSKVNPTAELLELSTQDSTPHHSAPQHSEWELAVALMSKQHIWNHSHAEYPAIQRQTGEGKPTQQTTAANLKGRKLSMLVSGIYKQVKQGWVTYFQNLGSY